MLLSFRRNESEIVVLWIMGGWGNRPDSLTSAVDRLQRSLNRFPGESGKYGTWGIWQHRDADDGTELDFVPVEVNDSAALANVIAQETDEIRGGPSSAPGLNIELSRPAVGQQSEVSAGWFKYIVRVGFTDMPRPFNHVALDVDDDTDERILMSYMSALVAAWQPDRLGVLTVDTKRAQGHRGSEVAVGRLTYIRDGVALNINVLGDGIDVAEADSGSYIRVPGTPKKPSLEHILRLRRALGYDVA